MAELAAFEAGAGLASSIIAFIDFSIEFAKLVKDVADAQGSLPKELEECRIKIDTVGEWLRAIQRSLQQRHVEAPGDILLRAAILRFLATCDELLDECQSYTSQSVPKSQNVIGKTKTLLRNVKVAGKIYWNRDKIEGFSQRMKNHQAEVHSLIATRTLMVVDSVAYVARLQRYSRQIPSSQTCQIRHAAHIVRVFHRCESLLV
jgi:N-terminal domain on NACHT_NTPase and P-loop NTPases